MNLFAQPSSNRRRTSRPLAAAAALAVLLAACGGGPEQDPPDASVPDAGPGPDGGSALVEPMSGQPHTWTRYAFLRTRCMNGSPASVAVNHAPDSKRLLIYLQEGGACWDPVSCALVANPDGFGQGDFDAFVANTGRRGIFNREDAVNPFQDWNQVFVPYCSGDVHAGSNPEGPGGRIHVGASNLAQFLERILVTFPDTEQVVLAGSSAGGVGALLNFERVVQAFDGVPVTLLDDSGPVMSDDFLKPCLQQLWRDAWNLNAVLPQDCASCVEGSGGMIDALTHLADKYPEHRLGLILSTQDDVFRNFFGFGAQECTAYAPLDGPTFAAGVLDLRDRVLAPHPNVRLYLRDHTQHVYLRDPMNRHTVDGVPMATWIRQLIEGDPAWNHVGP